ncbi:hypothetical protein ABID58_007497 [Bradyrhizobium sp. S3.2.6]
MPLTLRKIGPDDYTVHEDRQPVGRIRYASERSPGLWLWTCVVTLPGLPFGDAGSLDEAKGRFKVAWEIKAKHRPDVVAKAFEETNRAKRLGMCASGRQCVGDSERSSYCASWVWKKESTVCDGEVRPS